jgi:hypothetical protein
MYTGLRKRESYDEVVNMVENDKSKIKYPDRRATTILNSLDAMALLKGSAIDLEQQQEQMTKHKIMESMITQMSNTTNTHNVFNHYNHMPKQETTAGVDHVYDERLNKEAETLGESIQADGQARQARQ